MLYLLAILVFLLVVTGMALGLAFSGRPLAGSCGGLKALGADAACDICGGDPGLCDRQDGVPDNHTTGPNPQVQQTTD